MKKKLGRLLAAIGISANFTRASYHLVKGCYHLPSTIALRTRVKKRLGPQKWKSVKALTLTVFPNKINRLTSVFAIGYAIEKYLFVFGLKSEVFSPWNSSTDVYLDWQDLTCSEIDSRSYLRNSLEYRHKLDELEVANLINFNVRDISKKHVASVFQKVFGYELDINPLEYEGGIVVKSNDNAKHDGFVIDGPVKPEDITEGCVYSVCVNNTENGEAIDYRLVYMRGLADICYEKRRPVSSRFANANNSVTVEQCSNLFSREEIDLIEKFCEEMGLDYGDIDCLRDRQSGLLYLVDVAKTPFGPPTELGKKARIEALEILAVNFAENILSGQGQQVLRSPSGLKQSMP